jgi:hypothetical protein
MKTRYVVLIVVTALFAARQLNTAPDADFDWGRAQIHKVEKLFGSTYQGRSGGKRIESKDFEPVLKTILPPDQRIMP